MSRTVLPSGVVQSVLHNGVGRYVCQLQRVTLKFCKSHGASRGLRDYIENELLNFSQANPGIVVYLKPRRFRPAVLSAEYLNRERVELPVANLQADEIAQWMEHLRGRSGQPIVRLQKYWSTQSPSIQGIWTPYTNKDTRMNLASYPSEELGTCEEVIESATEKLIKMFEEQRLGNVVVDKGESAEAR